MQSDRSRVRSWRTYVVLILVLALVVSAVVVFGYGPRLDLPNRIPISLPLLLSGISLLIAYLERNWIRAAFQFLILGRDIEVVNVQTRDKHVDIGRGGVKDEFERSRGVAVDRLNPENRSLIGRLLLGRPAALYSELPDDTPTIRIERGQCELVLLAIRYNNSYDVPGISRLSGLLGNVQFDPFVWWVHTWPPEAFTVLPPVRPSGDGHSPTPSEGSLHTHDSLLLTSVDKPDSEASGHGEVDPDTTTSSITRTDSVVYPPKINKQLVRLRRGSVRGELPHYTAGHNIFVPLWIQVPENDMTPRWALENSDSPKATEDDFDHRLEVVVDPPRLPARIHKTLDIELVENVRSQFRLADGDSDTPIVETVEPADDTDRECRVAVVCCVHGDETCGREAVERFLSVRENLSVTEPVKFVLANPRATVRQQRCVDEDLNRLFGGESDEPNSETDSYERSLRESLRSELEGCHVLDLHSTESTSEPFAVTSLFEWIDIGGSKHDDDSLSPPWEERGDAEMREQLARDTGIVSHAVDATHIGGGMVSSPDLSGVAVECGQKGTKQAADNAYSAIRNFLLNRGVIDSDRDSSDLSAGDVATESEPEWYVIFDSVDEPECEFTGNNFEPVGHGETYATDGDRELKADGEFIPVLMSSSGEGYEDKLGYRAHPKEDLTRSSGSQNDSPHRE